MPIQIHFSLARGLTDATLLSRTLIEIQLLVEAFREYDADNYVTVRIFFFYLSLLAVCVNV